MKKLLFIMLFPAFLLAACSDNKNGDQTTVVTIRWDNLTLFDLSSVTHIDVTTAYGMQKCEFRNGQITISGNAVAITDLRIFVPDSEGFIDVDRNGFTLTDNVISITIAFVSDRATLEAVRNNLSGSFLQICNIDLSGGNWDPIGENGDYFTGTYDGGGFKISNMTIEVGSQGLNSAGLFRENGGTLRKIHLDATCSVSGEGQYIFRCGGICGVNYSYATITACSNAGEVTGTANSKVYCGGVCGDNYQGTIVACSNSGKVNGTGAFAYCGGVCGEVSGGVITACVNSGPVSGEGTGGSAYCGGVCGNVEGIITMCANSGNVNGESVSSSVHCGGVCGMINEGFALSACTNSGAVNGKSTSKDVFCGGVCGSNDGGAITACSGIGNVSGESVNGSAFCGGVCGDNGRFATIDVCYWADKEDGLKATGQNSAIVAETMKYGDGTSETGWPTSSKQGWGDTAPETWKEYLSGTWANPWSSLGGWNNGDPVYPTLKNI